MAFHEYYCDMWNVWKHRKTTEENVVMAAASLCSLQWRHIELDGVSNHQRFDCLPNRLCRRRSKKTPKPPVTGLCVGNPPVPDGLPTQRASNTENVSIWWRHNAPISLYSSWWTSPLGQSTSTSWFADAWLLVSPSHQQPWYWLSKMGIFVLLVDVYQQFVIFRC